MYPRQQSRAWGLLVSVNLQKCSLPLATCEARSSQETVVGSQLWYVDFTKEICVKDCKELDPDCGGISTHKFLIVVIDGSGRNGLSVPSMRDETCSTPDHYLFAILF